MEKPRIFKVTISAEATYYVRDDDPELDMTEEEAAMIAEGWFMERKPDTYVEELERSSFSAVDPYCDVSAE